MINPHEIDFSKFIKTWTIEGSREYFEKFIYQFLGVKYRFNKDLQKIRPDPGDWGIDIICGNLDDFNIIWQCKFFHEKVGVAQKKQIRESFNTVISKSKSKKFKIDKWILCIPIDFSPDEHQWWNNWKKKGEKNNNIDISSLTLSNFQEKCSDPDYQNLYKAYFRKEEIFKPHPEIAFSDVDNNSIFIQLIRNSDISTNLKSLKKNFFFADYFEKDIAQKSSEYEIQQLNTIYDELLNVWEIYHKRVYSNKEDDDGNELYMLINEYLINKIEYFNQKLRNLTIAILLGLILKMSDRKEIFWTRNLPLITN